ncbi:MAG: 2-hydroxyacid dehydrogenase, partial [Lachnospiraceae bacterium]
RHLMNYDAFSSMKNSAVVINVGRGPIIDEKDLVKALKENQIAGVALDVIENEPMSPACPLLELSNDERLIITPHVAWATFEARTRLMELVYDNIKSFLRGEKKNRVV